MQRVAGALIMQKTVGLLFVLLVLLLAGFAFSPRTDPPMPATQTRIDTLLMLDALATGSRIVAAGERGSIFTSDDHGHSWQLVDSTSQATLTALARVDEQTLVAVGHDAVILRSTDDGASWTQVHADAGAEEPLLAVHFDAYGNGLAVGAYGRFMTSADGGQSWQSNPVEGLDFHFNALAHTGSALIMAGEAGTLLRSFDGGESWETLESPYEGSFFGALSLRDAAVLVFGMRGHVFRSEDDGESWHEIDTGGGTTSMFGGLVLSDGRVVLVGQSGAVLISADGGQRFEPLAGAQSLLRSSLVETGDGEVLLIGEEGFERFRVAATGRGTL